MKFYLFMFFILICGLKGFSQVNKVYLTAKGKVCNDPTKAVTYVLIEKSGDSAYLVRKYDMCSNIMFKGSFKDTSMKVPNGEFFFYSNNRLSGSDEVIKSDTSVHVSTTGQFLNGLKEGLWIDYGISGIKTYIYTYKNNKLNGSYKKYDPRTGDILEEGNYLNNKKEGEFNIYRYGHDKPFSTYIYKHNEVIREIAHNNDPKASATLDKYIQQALDPYFDYLKSEGIVVILSIAEDGRVDSVKSINKPLNQDLQDAIKTAFLKSPNFEPGRIDDQPVKQIFAYSFRYGSSLKNVTDPAEQRRSQILSRHANDIGRGLNRVGIGTPVKN